MNRNQRIALAEKDLNVQKLATRVGFHPCYVTSILSGRFKSPGARKKIASELDKPENLLWPEKMDNKV